MLAELVAGTATLPWAELDREAWRRVGELAFTLRQAGVSVPLTDIEIAVACADSGAALWTRDDDFHRLHSALPSLQLYDAA